MELFCFEIFRTHRGILLLLFPLLLSSVGNNSERLKIHSSEKKSTRLFTFQSIGQSTPLLFIGHIPSSKSPVNR